MVPAVGIKQISSLFSVLCHKPTAEAKAEVCAEGNMAHSEGYFILFPLLSSESSLWSMRSTDLE